MFLIAIQRDLAVGDGVYGVAATAVVAGLFAGALYLNKEDSGIKLPLDSSSIVLLHV